MRKYIEVPIDLNDFSDEDLLEELECRNVFPILERNLVETIYHKRRQSLDYQVELDQLIDKVLGRLS